MVCHIGIYVLRTYPNGKISHVKHENCKQSEFSYDIEFIYKYIISIITKYL